MSTRIGLISDVHASPVALAEALQIFAEQRVDDIICAGDIAGYYDTLLPTVQLLIASGCKAIIGNHDQTWLEKNRGEDDTEDHKVIEIDEKSINFWLTDGVLDEIQWSPLFINDDTIKWPK